MLDSEKLFDQCVPKIGGVRVKDIVGLSPPFDNADYLFEPDNVVAEHKSLQKDFLTVAETEEKLHQLYNKWFQAGDVGSGYGKAIISTDQLPLHCQRELVSVFKNPFEQRLKKANRQIRETKEHFKCTDAIGLLLLSNDGNFALDPGMTAHILHHSLKTKFSQIEHVILFSPNVTVVAPRIRTNILPFFSINIATRRSPSLDFLNRVGSCWNNVLQLVFGGNIPAFGGFRSGSAAEIDAMRFHPGLTAVDRNS